MVAMALDEAKENDVKFEEGGITYVIEKDLFETGKPFEVYYNGMGFGINSQIKLEAGGCSGCSSSCSC